jgi:hypothetical protein
LRRGAAGLAVGTGADSRGELAEEPEHLVLDEGVSLPNAQRVERPFGKYAKLLTGRVVQCGQRRRCWRRHGRLWPSSTAGVAHLLDAATVTTNEPGVCSAKSLHDSLSAELVKDAERRLADDADSRFAVVAAPRDHEEF